MQQYTVHCSRDHSPHDRLSLSQILLECYFLKVRTDQCRRSQLICENFLRKPVCENRDSLIAIFGKKKRKRPRGSFCHPALAPPAAIEEHTRPTPYKQTPHHDERLVPCYKRPPSSSTAARPPSPSTIRSLYLQLVRSRPITSSVAVPRRFLWTSRDFGLPRKFSIDLEKSGFFQLSDNGSRMLGVARTGTACTWFNDCAKLHFSDWFFTAN